MVCTVPVRISSGGCQSVASFCIINYVECYNQWCRIISLFCSGLALLLVGLTFFVILFSSWIRDVIVKLHFQKTISNGSTGSTFRFYTVCSVEAMLFFAFFWAFFHSSQRPQQLRKYLASDGLEIIQLLRYRCKHGYLLSSGATITQHIMQSY